MNIGDESGFFAAVEQYQNAYERALELLNLYEDTEIEGLKLLQTNLEIEIEKFLNLTGLEMSDCGSLGRHLHFMSYYFDKGNKSSAEQDIRDIVFFDLPAGLRKLITTGSVESHFDQHLKDAVYPLLQGGHFDSAIRKAFVILTDRLRRAFAVTEDLDGEQLVNYVFGARAEIPLAMDDSKKQQYRNLIGGFYGVYRNRFAHNDIQPKLSEVKTILEMTNSIILDLEEISRTSRA